MKRLIIILMTLFLGLNTCAAETLKFSLLINNSKNRDTIRVLVRQFEAENPGLKVELHEKVNDAYHKWMETWEQTDMDVIWWFAGFQLSEYAKKAVSNRLAMFGQRISWINIFPALKNRCP